MTKIIWSFFFS